MYSLVLTCEFDQVDLVLGELWEANTSGVRELENGNASTTLIATFETNAARAALLERFSPFAPEWRREQPIDWVEQTRRSWPGRVIGERLFLATPWCTVPTPEGRERVVHNPGQACGTGEHPSTRLALLALERSVTQGCSVVDIGTGSGILSIAALRLGAATAIACDLDETALSAARENFNLNAMAAHLIAGSANCFRERSADIVVANINATVLLSMAEELLGILRPSGAMILTGFPQIESHTVEHAFAPSRVMEEDGWSCAISRPF